jgi:hypothetical protein
VIPSQFLLLDLTVGAAVVGGDGASASGFRCTAMTGEMVLTIRAIAYQCSPPPKHFLD